MIAIGFRAAPTEVCWAVIDGPELPLKLLDKNILIAPDRYSEAQSLAWYRTQLKTLFSEFNPARLAVRATEPNARGSTQSRHRIEGVILECGCTEGIEILSGPLTTLGSRLKMHVKDAKLCLKEKDFRGLIWPKAMSYREAIFAAAAALGV